MRRRSVRVLVVHVPTRRRLVVGAADVWTNEFSVLSVCIDARRIPADSGAVKVALVVLRVPTPTLHSAAVAVRLCRWTIRPVTRLRHTRTPPRRPTVHPKESVARLARVLPEAALGAGARRISARPVVVVPSPEASWEASARRACVHTAPSQVHNNAAVGLDGVVLRHALGVHASTVLGEEHHYYRRRLRHPDSDVTDRFEPPQPPRLHVWYGIVHTLRTPPLCRTETDCRFERSKCLQRRGTSADAVKIRVTNERPFVGVRQ